MPTDTVNLIQQVYDLFSAAYAKISTNQAFLAFEPMGIPLSDSMFKLGAATDYSQALAVERLSEIANKVPLVQDGTVIRGMNTVENVTGLMLTTSMPVSADAMVPLGAVKQAANSRFSDTIGSMSGVPNEGFRPVYATPADWYVATGATDWTSHSVGEQPPPANPPPRPVWLRPPIWRVLPVAARPALATPVSVGHPLLVAQSSVGTIQSHPESVLMHATTAGPVTAHPVLAMAAAGPVTHTVAVAPQSSVKLAPPISPQPAIKPLGLTVATSMLAASATAQNVGANSVSMSFDHCIVMLSRPWFPDQLMLLRDWFLPGYARGDVASGKGAGDTGLMPILTTGFVAIRNLRITSKWSSQDLTAIQGAASFGPFSLVGRSYDQGSGTLACPGMQIIAWFCSALPVVPPASDPALPTTAVKT